MKQPNMHTYKCLSISTLIFSLLGCGGAEQADKLLPKTLSGDASSAPSPVSSLAPSSKPSPTPSPTASPSALPTETPVPAPTSAPTPEASEQPKSDTFFNGQNLQGWHSAVQVNDQGITGADIWSVNKQGEIYAYNEHHVLSSLYTEAEDYQNYALSFEYKYNLEQRVQDSGIGIHGQGAFILSDGAFSASTQVQLRSGYEGDLLLRDMYIFAEDDCTTTADNGYALGRIVRRELPNLAPNQWNKVKIVSAITEDQDSTISVWVNGRLVNKGIRASHQNGRIVLQYEGSAIKFRGLTLTDIQADDYNNSTPCTVTPSPQPSIQPTAEPSPKPEPTLIPTAKPTAMPTVAPTVKPTPMPTVAPTVKPTAMPTVAPTAKPTAMPTVAPTVKPTAMPTAIPTAKPTFTPMPVPTAMPSSIPSIPPGLQLFNGKDFTGFGFSIQRRNSGFRAEDFWSVTEKGEIFADGNQRNLKARTPQSGLFTESEDYGNYELNFEYMYTEANRDDGNSGVWIHGGRDFVDSDRAFPASIEMQLRKGYEGDLLLKQLYAEAEPGRETSKDQNTENGRIHRRANPNTHSWGKWNHVKIITRETSEQGSIIEVWINGVYVNKGIKVGRSHGRITFQSEGADIMFRNIKLNNLAE